MDVATAPSRATLAEHPACSPGAPSPTPRRTTWPRVPRTRSADDTRVPRSEGLASLLSYMHVLESCGSLGALTKQRKEGCSVSGLQGQCHSQGRVPPHSVLSLSLGPASWSTQSGKGCSGNRGHICPCSKLRAAFVGVGRKQEVLATSSINSILQGTGICPLVPICLYCCELAIHWPSLFSFKEAGS